MTDLLMSEMFYHLESTFQNQIFDGRRRVIIERVSPEIDCGRYAAKRVSGESVRVGADIFGDGADTITAVLNYRRVEDSGWSAVAMEPAGNDRWEGSFIVGEPGRMEFCVEAWIDHFVTWKSGLRKKVDAGQDVSLELQIGALIVEKAASRASGRDARRLLELVSILNNADQEVAVEAAELGELLRLMHTYPDKSAATRYNKVLPVQVDPKIAGFSTWYELFPRSWAKRPGEHGSFNDCRRMLPLIGRMGFDVIYLPPVHPIGKTKRKGRNNSLVAAADDPGSCWAIGSPEGGHTALHPELGSIDDFRGFVSEAADHGISIALDIAFQCSPDHPWVKEHPKWFRWRPDGTVQFAENPPKRYEDILPIDFETEEWESLWTELKNVFLFWIDKGVKIFRVDNPHTKAFLFWDWAIDAIRREHPDTVFLAEAFTRPKVMARLAKGGYSQSYTYFTWRNTKHDLQEYLTELTTSELSEYMRPNFWPNTPDILHEELQHHGRPMFLIRMVLAATLSSNYGMYGPAYELCENEPVMEGKEEYLHSEKYEIKAWDMDRPGNIRAEITAVNHIRRANPALQQTNDVTFVRIDSGDGHEHDMLIGYVKKSADGTNVILTVVNLDPHRTQGGWLRFPLEQFGLSFDHRFQVEDLLAGRTYEWDGEWNFVSLNPASTPAHIFNVLLHS
ncbi:MAG: alpha-1,4-glucan--maltose-1-phosphate maltosyltransferase [Prosthecochloris sp.]|uniref:Alpha-1,4-glucan:maltose-1-phosphate maltosyltransferase n=1 Tax=Prosthecochloris aestuarii (strain DSM 271 / SK 413) TaxID=290512 RepID=B4S3S1_PROA2|nr:MULTISPECIES: alpha-1,4-glucan--maltose-1-phosphate maltosyltransferase [Prosthecochloris]ACF45267.1 alpha amylase catalytic region [Prosthecochloris aestuarii DSM 271]MCW8798336.1 alpha-1,4-glucan--maltose-1-phosphate maltosyltransferase [Prosthecochloris sp.]